MESRWIAGRRMRTALRALALAALSCLLLNARAIRADGPAHENDAYPTTGGERSDDAPEAEPARAKGPEELAGWIPSLAIGADIQTLDASATVASDLRGVFPDDRNFLSANPTLSGEILSPALATLPGRPRLFAHVGWQWGWLAIEDERFVVQEGSPGEIVFQTSTTPTDPPPELVDGQGSEVDLHIRNGWYAGLGTSFVVPIAGFQLRIKPSIDYYQQDVRYTGILSNVTCNITLVGGQRRCVKNTYAVQQINADKDQTLNAVGPRLGLEVEVAQLGPLAWNLFGEGFGYWYLGDHSVDFSGQSGSDTASFSAKVDSTVAGASFGVRVSWRGVGEY